VVACPLVRIFEIGGIRVTESGQGSQQPTILVVHGGSADGSAWSRVMDALPVGLRALRYDRFPYRAPTHTVSGAETMAREVEDLLAIAKAIGDPLLLVGHGSGAVVALQAARRRRFAGLVLYEPPVAVTEPLGGEALKRARAALDRGEPGKAMAIHLGDIVGMRGLARFMRVFPPLRRAMGRYAAGQIADDEALESVGVGLDQYAQVTTPALLLGGAKSPTHLKQRLAALSKTLPTVDSVVIMRGQGHMANQGAAAEVARIITEFANRVRQ
jgi:pimeloyl-ACP methyl ester carboxylesterase